MTMEGRPRRHNLSQYYAGCSIEDGYYVARQGNIARFHLRDMEEARQIARDLNEQLNSL